MHSFFSAQQALSKRIGRLTWGQSEVTDTHGRERDSWLWLKIVQLSQDTAVSTNRSAWNESHDDKTF